MSDKMIECDGVLNVIDEKPEEPKKEKDLFPMFDKEQKHGIGEIEVGYGV